MAYAFGLRPKVAPVSVISFGESGCLEKAIPFFSSDIACEILYSINFPLLLPASLSINDLSSVVQLSLVCMVCLDKFSGDTLFENLKVVFSSFNDHWDFFAYWSSTIKKCQFCMGFAYLYSQLLAFQPWEEAVGYVPVGFISCFICWLLDLIWYPEF